METAISNAADVAAIKTLINEGTLSVWSSYEDVVAAEVAAAAKAAEEAAKAQAAEEAAAAEAAEEEVVVEED